MMREHSEKSLPKSDARIEGAIIGLGAIFCRILFFSNMDTRGRDNWKVAVGGGLAGRAAVKPVTRSTDMTWK